MSIIFSYSSNISQWIHASSKALTLSWWRFLLYRNQSIYFSSNQWTGFRIIGTSVMKDSRRYSPTYTKSLFLHVAKHNLLLLFFFYLAFLSRMFTIHRTAGEWEGEGRRGGVVLSPYSLCTTSVRFTDTQTLVYCCRELTSAHMWQPGSWNLCYTLFRIHSFYTCTGSCCC